MPQLTVIQIKKRGQILEDMAASYWKQRPYLTKNEAYKKFSEIVERDHKLQRIINGMAAAYAKETI